MTDVSINDHQDPTQRRTIYAHSGTLALAPNRRDLIMTLYNGQMISAQTSRPGELSHIYYKQDRLRVPDVANQFQESSSDTTSKGDREMSVCEMQAQYDQAALDYRMAQYDALRARVATERLAGKTVALPPQPSATPPRSYGLGALYCRLITSLFHVQRAEAAELGEAQAPDPQVSANDFASSLREREALSRERTMLIEIHKKFSLAAACIVFVLVGAPIAMRFPRGGVGLVIAVSFGIFAIYDIGLVGGEALANNGFVPPFWSMWAVNILFLLVGLVMIARTGRESATARGGTTMAERVDATRLWFQRQRQRWGGGNGPLPGTGL
jgi:lipopolysaccharide export system permease protein